MRCAALLFALLLAACSTQLEVQGAFPSPVRQPMPFNGALVVDEELRNSVYRTNEGRKVQMAIGAAQAQMFETVIPELFHHLHVSDDFATARLSGADLVLLPELREIQVAMPQETQLKIYEVWLRYMVHVYTPEGDAVVSWPLSAYGKTQSQFLRSNQAALNQAALVALRDAGARLTVELERDPMLQRWMRHQLHRRALAEGG